MRACFKIWGLLIYYLRNFELILVLSFLNWNVIDLVGSFLNWFNLFNLLSLLLIYLNILCFSLNCIQKFWRSLWTFLSLRFFKFHLIHIPFLFTDENMILNSLNCKIIATDIALECFQRLNHGFSGFLFLDHIFI